MTYTELRFDRGYAARAAITEAPAELGIKGDLRNGEIRSAQPPVVADGVEQRRRLRSVIDPMKISRADVLRDPNSRGGSVKLLDDVQAGDTLTISAPRNHFALHSAANDRSTADNRNGTRKLSGKSPGAGAVRATASTDGGCSARLRGSRKFAEGGRQSRLPLLRGETAWCATGFGVQAAFAGMTSMGRSRGRVCDSHLHPPLP
ncbi:hypothetical protein BZM27_28120 [Paraburkholderia steynii]|uniref:Uncharacterized protein n=1 Tax=Paraburkholderia steynii TaxID=1245441 RepID=A0A4R0XIZ8_9BURK|nr:hypothetical protein BZM27_28120 [Paraburkholderia steynii]